MFGRVCGRVVVIASRIEKPAPTKTKRTKWLGMAGVCRDSFSSDASWTRHLRALGIAVLMGGFFPSGAALAQCTDNFPIIAFGGQGQGFFGFPKQHDFPLGTGSSLNALISTINTVNTAFLTSSSSFVGAPGDSTPNQQGGGVWGRAIAGNVETKSTTTSTIDASKTMGPLWPGQGICNGTVRQEYAGAQFGFDIMT
jgi:hypothetical protein